MKTAHAGLAISELEWEINMQVTEAVLQAHKIDETERGEFLSLFTRYKPEIVETQGQ
jgi:hemoglobin